MSGTSDVAAPAARQTLALCPGLLSDDWVWQAQIAALSDVARCHVMDFSTQDSIAAMAESALAALPARFALAGWSMGGYVAMEMWRLAPERISRLALIDTQPRADTPEQAERRAGLIARTRAGGFAAVIDEMRAFSYHDPERQNAALMTAHRAMSERVGPTVFLRQQAAIMGRADQRDTLAGVTCPTLILCGRHDATTPLTESRAMARIIPHAELVVLEDCAHMTPVEAPDAVSTALRGWLQAKS